MQSSPRSFRVALRILIPFLPILFFTSVACNVTLHSFDDPNLQTPYTAEPKINLDRTLTARAADMEEMDLIRPTETPIRNSDCHSESHPGCVCERVCRYVGYELGSHDLQCGWSEGELQLHL